MLLVGHNHHHAETVRQCLSMKSVSISKQVAAVTAHAAFGAKNSSRAVDPTGATAATVAMSYSKHRRA